MHDPATGVISSVLAADPRALAFDEPDDFAHRGCPTFLGSMDFPSLVFNFHVHCGARSPKTGNPTNVTSYARHEIRTLDRRRQDLVEVASRHQPNGPAWFMSEFGTTADPALLVAVTARADTKLLAGRTGRGGSTPTRPAAQPRRW